MAEDRRSWARLGGWFGGAARRRAEELAEAEARITAFGAALDEHDFSPGEPGATDAMRVRGAAGGAARRGRRGLPVPRRVGSGAALRQPGPLRAAAHPAAGEGAGERAYGQGPGSARVRLPAVGRPAVLVVRSDSAEQLTVVLLLRHNQRKGFTLGDGFEPVHARVPLRLSGNREVARFLVEFRGAARADWEAWAEPADAVPKFTERIHGRGGDLVRYAGPGGPAVLRHRGRGDVRLLALDDDLAEWAEAARGKGDADLPLRLPGPGVYQVQARGSWVIESEAADEDSEAGDMRGA